jgi:oligosaccharide repeat unit polymerase
MRCEVSAEMLWKPANIALIGIVFWLVIWLVSPLMTINPISLSSALFIALCYIGFFAGCLFAGRFLGGGITHIHIWNNELNMRAFAVTSIMGLIGMALRYYDRAVVRGVEYGQNSVEVREALTNAAASFWGITGSVFLPFCFMPLIYILAAKWQRRNIALFIVAVIIFSLPMIESLAQLSRSIMLMTVFMMFVAVVCFKFNGDPLHRKILFTSLFSAMSLLILSSAIFSVRLNDGNIALEDSVIDSVYAANIGPTPEAVDSLANGSPLVSQFYRAVLPNSMYYLSGAYEFSLLWERPDNQEFGYGSYMFSPVVKVINLAFENKDPGLDEETLAYRTGVFNTFFGPVWIDFGWIGPIFCLLFGFVATSLGNKARSGNLAAAPLYFYAVVIAFYMPVLNFISSGYGIFVITAFGLFAFFANRVGWIGSMETGQSN